MKINTSHFCGLSSNADFRNWLEGVAPHLLRHIVDVKGGCRSKRERMMAVYKELYRIGHGAALETFITERFPYMVKESTRPQAMPSRPPVSQISLMNKHKVFRSYRPDLLSFPQKYILSGEPASLNDRVKEFIHDKVGVDFIIIEDRAYIEYFQKKYADVASQILPEDREISQYRKRVGK